MCGRFALYSSAKDIVKHFAVSNPAHFEIKSSYNIAPSQPIVVICEIPNGERVIEWMRWGLIPFWTKKDEMPSGAINARVETVDTKPSFRRAIRQRRCLVVANGFYEWRSDTKPKQPFYIQLKDHNLFAIAAIWEQWAHEAQTINSCALITVPANKALGVIHERMPAIIEPQFYAKWLKNSNQDIVEIKNMLTPYPSKELDIQAVSKKVNNIRNDDQDCIRKIDDK